MRRLLVGLAIASIAALSPNWAQADDQQIAQQIVQQLRQQKDDGNLTGFGIDLEVESGIVWLKGHVTEKEQQALILDIARHVSGVEQVVNDIRIKRVVTAEKTPARPAVLQSAGKTNLLKKPSEVLASVWRRFSKDSKPAIERQPTISAPAEEIRTSLVKATKVVQASAPAPSDSALAEAIIGGLRAKKNEGTLRNFDVDVQVDNAVVWVSGRVASKGQQTLVLDVARRVRGVAQVVNDLHVAAPAPVQTVSAPSLQSAAGVAPVGTAVPAPARLQPVPTSQRPLAFAPAQAAMQAQAQMGQPVPEVPHSAGVARARFDNPSMPGYAWPSYAAYPNYGAVTYPRQYSASAWPYIGPFYPYPQVPLGWRKVSLEWDDGWWMLDFSSK